MRYLKRYQNFLFVRVSSGNDSDVEDLYVAHVNGISFNIFKLKIDLWVHTPRSECEHVVIMASFNFIAF